MVILPWKKMMRGPPLDYVLHFTTKVISFIDIQYVNNYSKSFNHIVSFK